MDIILCGMCKEKIEKNDKCITIVCTGHSFHKECNENRKDGDKIFPNPTFRKRPGKQ